MKFNLIISNPPYNKGLDLKILESVLELGEKICFVHPVHYLIEKKGTHKKTREKLASRLKSVEIFNGNPIFKIALFTECGIVYCEKQNSGKILYDNTEFDDIHRINKFSNSGVYLSLEKKIREKMSTSLSIEKMKNVKTCESSVFVNLSGGRAHVEQFDSALPFRKNDFYTIVQANLEIFDYPGHHSWQFEKKEDAQNFISYLKTKVARFCVSILKNNMHLDSGELQLLPWLDFSKKIDDAYLCEYFQITREELEWIHQQIPNYYKEDI